jgi:YebC/PmpR family DNA-binding regulatory protein
MFMAGHSQFKNIMHRKGAQDRKKAKIFTKISRDITVAVREAGSDPNTNPRLRTALGLAKDANMPKDIIQRATAKGEGIGGEGNYEDILYEAFLPGGIGLLIEVNTDNRNRSVSEIRALLNRYKGNLGESNSVSFLFRRQALLIYTAQVSKEEILEKSIECGASDVVISAGRILPEDEISTNPEEKIYICLDPDQLSQVRTSLQDDFGEALDSQMVWLVDVAMPILDPVHRENLEKVLEKMEEIDGVYGLWHNGAYEDDSVPSPWN